MSSMLKYFSKISAVHNDSNSTSNLTNKERRVVDECVNRALKENSKKSEAGRQNRYTDKEWASVGKYAAQNGPTKAARRFSKLLKRDIDETTARKLRS